LNNNYLDISYLENIPRIKNKPWKFINDADELQIIVEDLKQHRILGVDLEFHSDKRIFIASLLQISTLECDYVVDVLVLREKVGPVLTQVFSDPNIVKVFHGWDYDILLLLTDLEIDVLNVFDTARAFRSMMKVSTDSEPHLVSFEYLVSALLGIKTNKFFQVAEWRLRPLPKVMMNYCRADSHYLLFIYAIIIDLMADAKNEVALLNSTIEENKEWLNERKKNSSKWKGVLRDFSKKMSKFMVQRIEKSGTKTYQVVVHDHH
jgi:exosome complex exonuclease RRP6